MKKVMRLLLAALTLTTIAAFAQDESEAAIATDTQVATEPAKPEEPAKEGKKAPVAVGSKEERPIGIRAGFHISSVAGNPVIVSNAATVSWQLGVLYDVMRIFEVDLGEAFLFRILLEPGVFITPKNSAIDGDSQYWLEMPITAAFTLSMFGGMRVKYALGPYVALGTIGSFSEKADALGIKYETTQSRLDIGQWHTFGFEQNNFKNWWFDATFAFGFMESVTVKVDEKKTKVKDSVPFDMKFTLGYNF
jgi:hypothetical protein